MNEDGGSGTPGGAGAADVRIGGVACPESVDVADTPIGGEGAEVFSVKVRVIDAFPWTCRPCEGGQFTLRIELRNEPRSGLDHSCRPFRCEGDAGATADADSGINDFGLKFGSDHDGSLDSAGIWFGRLMPAQ